MKRLLSLALAAAVTLALPACAMRNNNRIDTRNMGGTNNGTSGQRLSVRNNAGTTGMVYKDGTYTAVGDPHVYGNEQATVVVRGGRIAGISLTNIGQQNYPTNHIGNGTATYQQGRTNNQSGDGMGMNKPGGTETGNDNLTGVNFQGANNLSGSGWSNTSGLAGGIVKGDAGDDAINEVRTRLADMMYRQQRTDVAYNVGYGVDVSRRDAAYLNNMVNNWKVAAARALSQAAR